MNCELCKLSQNPDKELITKLHYIDNKIIICDCKSCKIPMLVWRKHTMTLGQEDLEYILEVLKKEFPDYEVRMNQRKIKNHLHWHLLK